MGFKPNLHEIDWRYSVKNYFIGFVRKFYPNLIYKQIKFRCFLQILQYWDIEVYWNICGDLRTDKYYPCPSEMLLVTM